MAAKARQPRLGKQPPRYRFFLNPYPEARCTVCPECHESTEKRWSSTTGGESTPGKGILSRVSSLFRCLLGAKVGVSTNAFRNLDLSSEDSCHAKTRQRRLPLVIHVDPLNPVALNKTCRYCPACDLLIAHQDEVEALLSAFFSQHEPKVIGNEYLVIGTLDRPDWQRGTQSPMPIREMVEHLHDFKAVVRFKLVGGWQRK